MPCLPACLPVYKQQYTFLFILFIYLSSASALIEDPSHSLTVSPWPFSLSLSLPPCPFQTSSKDNKLGQRREGGGVQKARITQRWHIYPVKRRGKRELEVKTEPDEGERISEGDIWPDYNLVPLHTVQRKREKEKRIEKKTGLEIDPDLHADKYSVSRSEFLSFLLADMPECLSVCLSCLKKVGGRNYNHTVMQQDNKIHFSTDVGS